MVVKHQTDVEAFQAIADGLIVEILSASEEEILDEARELYGDENVLADQTDAIFERALRQLASEQKPSADVIEFPGGQQQAANDVLFHGENPSHPVSWKARTSSALWAVGLLCAASFAFYFYVSRTPRPEVAEAPTFAAAASTPKSNRETVERAVSKIAETPVPLPNPAPRRKIARTENASAPMPGDGPNISFAERWLPILPQSRLSEVEPRGRSAEKRRNVANAEPLGRHPY
jgi:hypothetical protein